MTGFKTIIAAAGLALASSAGVAAAPTAAPGAATTTTAPEAAAPATAAPAAAPTAAVAKPADPTLAADGSQLVKPVAHVGQPTDGYYGIQTQVTKNGETAHWFHDSILFPLITIISIFVLGLLIYVVFRFREKANPVPSKTSHNTFIEIVWTLVPVLILVAIAVPSIRLLAAQYAPPPKGAVTLKAIGNQWYWSYEYPDHGGIAITANMLKEQSEVPAGTRYRTDADGPRLLAADNRIVLPVGVPIRLLTTAADVIHSWAVPAFWIKLDAVPGRINETSFTIDKPGVYFGQCSELCGARHGYMPITVEAVSPQQFAAWVAAKGGTMPGAAAPAASGADATDDTATPATAAVPGNAAVENATVTAETTNQAATANNGAGGNPGR
ncbi:cytochrome c oxidase subunit II [Sphingomonas donggukensis]|uniref:Cytochrome c oxidase subunit 2 n=2 Tax=Sphingomonas donggukensis TaxID=2949093 RepID=A0ABY4TRG5_9SPHN|nr:cytochrome c oxidase subunit II [Sphingomonas donggukensis]URW74975.1 cytochrome c oxidase subunit II [Sphingomonas donggukensis]